MLARRKEKLPFYLRTLQQMEYTEKYPGFILNNFHSLLRFWQQHYLNKDKDSTCLENVRGPVTVARINYSSVWQPGRSGAGCVPWVLQASHCAAARATVCVDASVVSWAADRRCCWEQSCLPRCVSGCCACVYVRAVSWAAVYCIESDVVVQWVNSRQWLV